MSLPSESEPVHLARQWCAAVEQHYRRRLAELPEGLAVLVEFDLNRKETFRLGYVGYLGPNTVVVGSGSESGVRNELIAVPSAIRLRFRVEGPPLGVEKIRSTQVTFLHDMGVPPTGDSPR